MAERYIKVISKDPTKRVGDGEYKIPVQVFHKGLRKDSFYKKDELYRMLGDANVHIKSVETDLVNIQTASDDDHEHLSIAHEIVLNRNKILLRRFIAWRISTAILALLVAYLLYLVLFHK